MEKGFGIVSLLLGIAGLILPWIPYLTGIWLVSIPIAAIVFGIVGFSKDESKVLGLIGLILGIAGIVNWILVYFFLAPFLATLLEVLFP